MRIKDSRSLYMDEVFGAEDSLLKTLSKTAESEGVSQMSLAPHEGRILYLLARLIQAQKVVEIGSLYSYSTVYLARALPDTGRIWTCDVSKDRHQRAQEVLKNTPEYHKIHWVTGPAAHTLPALTQNGPFDMVFIDADKDSYSLYLDWAEENLRKGGLLAADNTFLFGSVYGDFNDSAGRHSQKTLEGMKSFNKRLSRSEFWEGALVPTAEGLTVAIRK